MGIEPEGTDSYFFGGEGDEAMGEVHVHSWDAAFDTARRLRSDVLCGVYSVWRRDKQRRGASL